MYPINLVLKGKDCIVVGGGKVALRKVRGLLAAEARVTVIAPEVTGEFLQLVKEGELIWLKQSFEQGKNQLSGAVLVFAATDSMEINALVEQEAHKVNALVNSVNGGTAGDFQVPSSVRRGDLLFTVSTSGSSPAFSRLLRQDLECQYGGKFSKWLEIQEKWRNIVKERFAADTKKRERFWRQLMDNRGKEILELVRNGNLQAAEELLDSEVKILEGVS